MRSLMTMMFPMLFALAGCGGNGVLATTSEDLDSTVDAQTATDAQSALAITLVSGAMVGSDSSATASDAAAGATALLEPSGCVVATTVANKVTYVFTNCSGRYGLEHVNGSITATYTEALPGIHVALSSDSLKVGTTSLDLEGSATYTPATANNSTSTLTLTPSGSATSARNHVVAWSGDMTLGWSTTCATLDGDLALSIDTATWTMTATNYERCAASCPAAGGVLGYTGPRGSLTFDFDGSATAKYTTDKTSGTVLLLCGS